MKKMKVMKVAICAAALALSGYAGVASAQGPNDPKGNMPQSFFFEGPDEASVGRLLEYWPETSRKVARVIIEKYGQPQEAISTMLVWNNNAPWKRTIVYRDEVAHAFPVAHQDTLEQVVDYKVPANKTDDLANYNGSITVFRTRGEISARGDKEESNILALNLAEDVIKGNKSAEQARKAYGKALTLSMTGKTSDSMTKLQFGAQTKTADEDKVTLKDFSGRHPIMNNEQQQGISQDEKANQ